MQFVMGGQIFTLKQLDAQMDQAFLDLHAAHLGNHHYNWAIFEQTSLEFFDRVSTNPGIQDDYFTNFTIIWRNLLNNGRLDEAEHIWELALQPALNWQQQHKDHFIHKGTPYYFWGMTSLIKGNLDRGYALIHQSLEEDFRTNGTTSPDTPGFAFATLNFTKTDQAFREWVLLQAEFLSEIITTYSQQQKRPFTVDDFRARFLSRPPNLDIAFLFVYSLARLRNLQRIPVYALSSAFAGQLEINLLFDVTLVIDAAIKSKNSGQWKFIDHAAFLSSAATLGLSRDHLEQVNRQFNNDFDKTLSAILDGSFRFTDGGNLTPTAGDLAITYGLRNYAAHNVSSASVVWMRFNDIKQRLFNILFLVVETLY